jgi:uncharacterized protein Yka (UPF0111/DUF47 family)
LPENLDLEDPEAIRGFVKSILVPAALTGKLGVRVVTAVTSALKLLLDTRNDEILELRQRISDLEHQGEQREMSQEVREQLIVDFVKSLPPELERCVSIS